MGGSDFVVQAASRQLFWMLSICAATLLGVQLCAAETLQTVYRFTGGSDGENPTGVVAGPDDALYVTVGSMVDQVKLTPDGHWRVTPIVSAFAGLQSLVPFGRSLFGVLPADAISCHGRGSCGEVVEITHDASGWTLNRIYAFKGGRDGRFPVGITIDSDGVIYGLTYKGGGSGACGSENNVFVGCGTLFSLTNVSGKWTEKILHAFAGGSDGQFPAAAPSLDSAGNIFGTTTFGGGNGAQPMLGMTFAEVTAKARLMSLRDGTGAQGLQPASTPYIDNPTNPVGGGTATESIIVSASQGGKTNDCEIIGLQGCGTVFMLTGQPGSKPWRYNRGVTQAFTSSTQMRVANRWAP